MFYSSHLLKGARELHPAAVLVALIVAAAALNLTLFPLGARYIGIRAQGGNDVVGALGGHPYEAWKRRIPLNIEGDSCEPR